MGRAYFDNADFLDAARVLAAKHGPAAVTVGAVAAHLKAPTGSFYHRFKSRDLLLGELWLDLVLAYQVGFLAALEARDGLAAALHMPRWVRAHLEDARLLLLYSRHDFVQGDWPKALKQGVRDQARRLEAAAEKFSRDTFGSAAPEPLRRTHFILANVPFAAVRPHLERREPPPPLVDELIRATYWAVVEPPGEPLSAAPPSSS